jgi:hypothetical protein
MQQMIMLGWLLALLLSTQPVFAVKWNLTSIVKANSSFVAMNQDPSSIPADCTVTAICRPAIISLAANQAWYWCGWSAIQQSQYTFNASSGGLITVQLMRQAAISSCSPSSIKSCEVIYGSLVDTLNFSNWKVAGMAFSDEICIVLANNNAKPVSVTLQFFQWYDSSRYYGTIFTIIMTILLLGGVLTYIGWTCYSELTKTSDRVAELRNFEAELSRNASEASLPQNLPRYRGDKGEAVVSDNEEEEEETKPGTSSSGFGGKVKGAFSSLGLTNLMLRKQAK